MEERLSLLRRIEAALYNWRCWIERARSMRGDMEATAVCLDEASIARRLVTDSRAALRTLTA